jgi:hypothetical protein
MQTSDGLWQINTHFNKLEKKNDTEVSIENLPIKDKDYKLILDTVELDSSEVIKLKKDIN